MSASNIACRVAVVVVMLLGAGALLDSGVANAEVGSWECISPSLPVGTAYRLPANSGWTDLGFLDFNHLQASDYILTGTIFLTNGNTADSPFDVQFLVDGTPSGWFSARVPEDSPSELRFQTVAANLAAGEHTVGLRASNYAANPIYFDRVWIHPFLLSSSETTQVANLQNTVAIGTSWTTLLSRSLSITATKMPYIQGYVGFPSGAGNPIVEFRVRRGTTQLVTYQTGVLDNFWDGFSLSYIDKAPPTGTQTYYLDARKVSGTSVNAGPRSLTLETMPRYTVFDALSASNSIPSNDTWYDLAATPWQPISTTSHGPYGSDGAGFATFSTASPTAGNVDVRLQLDIASPALTFEVGWVGNTPAASSETFWLASDWEHLGLATPGSYRMRIQGIGYCQPAPNVEFRNTRFQVMPIPANKDFTQFPCDYPDPTIAATCCDNHFPACTIYQCYIAPGLTLVPGIPPGDCF